MSHVDTTRVVDEKPASSTTPTQVANPKRTTVRTFVQSAVGLVLIVNIVTPFLIDSLKSLPEGWVPGWVFLVLNGVAVATAALIALVARIMAADGVNAAIEKYLPWLAALRLERNS